METNKEQWNRNCPKCDKKLSYEYKAGRDSATKRNSVCNSCKQIGSKNPFYGKKHTDGHKNHLKELHKNGNYKNQPKLTSEKLKGREFTTEHCEQISNSLISYFKENEIFNKGKTFEEIYGNERAKELKKVLSDKTKKWYNEYRKTDEYKEWKRKQPQYKLYYMKVQEITQKNDLSVLENYSKKNLYHKYELDHIYPISVAFKNDIPAELVGHIDNLRIIPGKQNRQKNNKIIEDIIPNIIIEYLKNE